MSKKLETLVDELSKLTVLEMSELKQQLEDKWGVTAAAPAAAVVAAPQDGGAKEEEATDFSVILEEVPAAKKIAVIKIIREVTGLGLKEAKEVAESAPKPVKDSAPKEEAEELKKKFEEAGAKVTLKAV